MYIQQANVYSKTAGIWAKPCKRSGQWGPYLSESFTVTNGVRRGGILNRYQLTINLDELSVLLGSALLMISVGFVLASAQDHIWRWPPIGYTNCAAPVSFKRKILSVSCECRRHAHPLSFWKMTLKYIDFISSGDWCVGLNS